MPNQKSRKKPLKGTSKKPESPSKQNYLIRRLALTLIAFGLILVSLAGIIYFNQTIQLSVFTPKAKAITHSKLAEPVEVTIPSINLDLSIYDTAISNGIWEIAKGGASYLEASAKPGQKGAIIMYGHNTLERFKLIKKLTPGKTIILRTTDNKLHVYKVSKTLEVYPTRMDVFEQKEETLILYTCSGFADLKRFIVIAKPES